MENARETRKKAKINYLLETQFREENPILHYDYCALVLSHAFFSQYPVSSGAGEGGFNDSLARITSLWSDSEVFFFFLRGFHMTPNFVPEMSAK